MLLRFAGRAVLALVLLLSILVLVNLGLTLVLYGSDDGWRRIRGDWERIFVAHAVQRGELTPEQAFAELYGPSLGPAPQPRDIRTWLAEGLEQGEPMVWDVTLAEYLTRRFGAIDGRSLPPGIYLGAGPIGPDGWPGPIFTHFVMFPRHGYLLVVPPPDGGRAEPAFEATASRREDLAESGDGGDLFAVVTEYNVEAFDFPTAGEPVHDLFLLSSDPDEIEAVAARLRSAARRVDRAELGYALLSRNSNSALVCFLRTAGLPQSRIDRLSTSMIVRLRLPGIGRSVWKSGADDGIGACTSAPE